MNPSKRKQKLEEARLAFAAGDAASAERICLSLLRANKADVLALHGLGVMASARRDDAAASGFFARCVAIEPGQARYHNDLARVHALAGRYPAALACLRRALALQPGNRQALTDLADVLERAGQRDEAWRLVEPFVQAGSTPADMAPVAMRLLDHAGKASQAIDIGRRLLAAPGGEASTRRFLLQLLGRLHDRAGDWNLAFACFAEAKASENPGFSPLHYQQDIDTLIRVFSAPALAALPRGRTGSQLPVFIACMPRSGSTLVEQIIHAHPQAFGAGEHSALHQAAVGMPAVLQLALPYPHGLAQIDQGQVDSIADSYLQTMQALAPAAARITNKHLLNYLHLGLVAVLFPGARVVHIQRDAVDNGLACFMTSLSEGIMPWASDLAHIGFAFKQYQRLMAHWRQSLDLQLLELRYEELVEDTAATVQRITDFCGLPPDARCLRFWEAERVVLTPSYDQVRQPIFRSALGRSRHYEKWLGPLRDALG